GAANASMTIAPFAVLGLCAMGAACGNKGSSATAALGSAIGVSGSLSGIYGVSAFKNPSTGDFAIVVVNSSGSDIADVSFAISGAAISGSVIPYVTSGTAIGAFGSDGNLSAGSTSSNVPTSITPVGNTFTSTVPYGFITFVGRAN